MWVSSCMQLSTELRVTEEYYKTFCSAVLSWDRIVTQYLLVEGFSIEKHTRHKNG